MTDPISPPVNVLKLHLKALEASPASTVLSLTAPSAFSTSSPESLSDAEASDEDVRASPGAGVLQATATPGTAEPAKVFRDYANACDRVRSFYAEQHAKQTFEFNRHVRDAFRARPKRRMAVWEAMETLNEWTDDSDPDVRPPPSRPPRSTA